MTAQNEAPRTPKEIVEALARKAARVIAVGLAANMAQGDIAETFAPVEKLIKAAQEHDHRGTYGDIDDCGACSICAALKSLEEATR